jgi:hypothetical protein
MIQEQNLKRSIAKRRPPSKASAFCRAQEYRQRADEYINLYLTRFVSSNTVDEYSYRAAVADYSAAVREFETDIRIKETHYPCSCVFDEKGRENDPRYLKTEALLAHGNAIKESFVPAHRTGKNSFVSYKEEATFVYGRAFEYAQEINYGQYSQFTLLEQKNLEARAMSWHQGKPPRRIVVFHTTLSPRSQHILKGVYYYAFKSGVEVWEYSEGRIPRSAISLSFLKDRIVDCCGIVFLASEQYIPDRDNIEFEIDAANIFRDTDDPVKIFPIDLGANEEVMNRISSNEVKARKIDDFENEFLEFLEALSDIYDCREKRLENGRLWARLARAGLNRNEF